MRKGKKMSKSLKEKIRKSCLGKRFSEEHKRKISEGNKRRYIKFPNLKKKLSDRFKKEKCNFWKGGIYNYKRKIFLNFQYRSRKQKAEGFFTLEEWELLKRQYGYICPSCKRKEPEITLEPDHIIPISKGGSNYIENIQPLCGSCNSKKHTNIIKFRR